MANCQAYTLVKGWVEDALMMAPMVKLLVALLVVWMFVSVVLVLSASRLTVQGGGVLACMEIVPVASPVSKRVRSNGASLGVVNRASCVERVLSKDWDYVSIVLRSWFQALALRLAMSDFLSRRK